MFSRMFALFYAVVLHANRYYNIVTDHAAPHVNASYTAVYLAHTVCEWNPGLSISFQALHEAIAFSFNKSSSWFQMFDKCLGLDKLALSCRIATTL